MVPRKILTTAFSRPNRDARLAQWTCHAIALFVLVLGILDITTRSLTEFQLLVGTILIGQLTLLMVIVGYLVPIVTKIERESESNK